MCGYDALICACPVINDWVRVDQSQADCSREHQCPSGLVCPIEDQFLACIEASETESWDSVALIDPA